MKRMPFLIKVARELVEVAKAMADGSYWAEDASEPAHTMPVFTEPDAWD